MRLECGLASIGIGDGQGTASGEGGVFGDSTGIHANHISAADHRRVVIAVDGDLDGGSRPVDGSDGVGLGQDIAHTQSLDGGQSVVQRKSPGAIGGERESAIRAGGGSLRLECGLASIGIGDLNNSVCS